MNPLIQKYKNYRNVANQVKANALYNVQFYNYWKQDVPDMWFYKFINSRGLLKKENKRICFFSTFGDRNIVKKVMGDVKVFFTGENLKKDCHRLFSDHLLSCKEIDLALGFEYFEEERYIRFPLWLLYMFEPESKDEDIINRCKTLNRPAENCRHRFACHISSEDSMGLRKKICETVSQIEKVDCAGKVMHNCDDLWKVFGDDKKKYISEYKFNICPENSNCCGYVTEKVFQAIDAGCVPIYWGSWNNPEPEVLNNEAIVMWNKEGDNEVTMDFIRQLYESESRFEEYAHQDRLRVGAAEYVIGKFQELETRLRELI